MRHVLIFILFINSFFLISCSDTDMTNSYEIMKLQRKINLLKKKANKKVDDLKSEHKNELLKLQEQIDTIDKTLTTYKNKLSEAKKEIVDYDIAMSEARNEIKVMKRREQKVKSMYKHD